MSEEEEIEKVWSSLSDPNATYEAPKYPEGEPSALWTNARRQMLALERRVAKRAQAEEERQKERDANLLAMRRQYEDVARKNQLLAEEIRLKREEEQRAEEERRAEARRREKERLEGMAPTIQLDDTWDVYS